MRADAAQLFFVRGGKFFERPAAAIRECEMNLATVTRPPFSNNQPLGCQAINQSNGAVMADLQTFGQFADGDASGPAETLDGQQRLVLLGRDSRLLRRLLTEPQKLTQ